MITAYHRPETVEQTLALLNRPTVKTALLVGYDVFPHLDVDEVVDIQALNLTQLEVNQPSATIGAGVRLQTLLENQNLPVWLLSIIKAEMPNTFRSMRTLYSIIYAPQAESSLLAALLVCDAQILVAQGQHTQSVALTEYLTCPLPGLILSIQLALDGCGSEARVGRTPADAPIVAAVGRRGTDGKLRLALCGVASRPLLVTPEGLDTLQPQDDFRGSSAYRQEMAHVLSQRVMSALA